jgi:hypothetical protein
MGDINFDTITGVAGMGVVIAAVELMKRIFPTMPDRLYPLCSLVVALMFNVGVALYKSSDVGLAVVVGIVVALMSSGLYSGGRTVTGI